METEWGHIGDIWVFFRDFKHPIPLMRVPYYNISQQGSFGNGFKGATNTNFTQLQHIPCICLGGKQAFDF